jgi:hypothetical protein
MKSIDNQIAEVIEKKSQSLSEDEVYLKLRDYYLSMKEKGLITPLKYSIPPLDTIGRRMYQYRQNVK